MATESLAFGASYKDTDKGSRTDKILAAFDLMSKGKGKSKGDETRARLAREGWTFWQEMRSSWVLTEQFRARNDPEWNKLCKRRRCSYKNMPKEQRLEQQAKDEKLLRGITLGAPNEVVTVKLPSALRDWGVSFETNSLRIKVTMDPHASDYGRLHVVEGSPAGEAGVGSGWRPWVVVDVAGEAVSSRADLEAALGSAMVDGDDVEVKFLLLGRRVEDLDGATGVFYHNDVVTRLGNAQGDFADGVRLGRAYCATVELRADVRHPPLS